MPPSLSTSTALASTSNHWKASIFLAGAFLLLTTVGCGKDDAGNDTLATDTSSYGTASEESVPLEPYDSTAESEQFQEAITNLDLEECEGIENQIFKDACVTNVALAMAKQNKDESACDLIEDEEAKEYCLGLVSEEPPVNVEVE